MMGTSSIPTFANFIPHEFDVLTCLMRFFQSSQQRDETGKNRPHCVASMGTKMSSEQNYCQYRWNPMIKFGKEIVFLDE